MQQYNFVTLHKLKSVTKPNYSIVSVINISLTSILGQPRKRSGRKRRYQVNRENAVVVNVDTRSTAKARPI
uniref:Uncharacterized protein n=1 Tax=Timema genevievae TaxID=629358 RepID=A0A7R9PSK5_TIMGE|nr:unnamed protein product [Timema genevievae]